MASILTPDQSSKWFSPISGLTSLTSAAAGLTVSNLVEKVGLPGALIVAGFILISSLVFTETAYSLADANGFTPAPEQMKKTKRKKVQLTTYKEETSLIKKASALFSRVPVLKALFTEILAGQGLATLLNVCFVTKLSEEKPVDSERAGWMGKFFASINIVAMILQFGVIPKVMPYLETGFLWRVMPSTMVVGIAFLCLNANPSLQLISACFMLFKVMEFSIRRMLDEMVYVPLDFESRFLGKEIISVFGYRFGKSGMSLALSGLTSLFGNFGIQELSYLTGGSACLWLAAAWNVSNRVLSKAEAEQIYQSKKLPTKKKWMARF
jgi:ATP/ADP translocase